MPRYGFCQRKRKMRTNCVTPPRILTPERAARAFGYVGRARLPRSSYVYGLKGCQTYHEPPTNIYCESSISDLTTTMYQTSNSLDELRNAIPCLRGGSGGDQDDQRRVPPTLWLLAGGQGRPITISSWEKQKPKKRMDGLLGMAFYGRQAGIPYEPKGKKVKATKARKSCLKSADDATTGQSGTERKVHFKLPEDGPSASSPRASNGHGTSSPENHEHAPTPEPIESNEIPPAFSPLPAADDLSKDTTASSPDTTAANSPADNVNSGPTNHTPPSNTGPPPGAPADTNKGGDSAASAEPGESEAQNNIKSKDVDDQAAASANSIPDTDNSKDAAVGDGGSTDSNNDQTSATANAGNEVPVAASASASSDEKTSDKEQGVPGYKRGRKKRTSILAGGEGDGKGDVGDM